MNYENYEKNEDIIVMSKKPLSSPIHRTGYLTAPLRFIFIEPNTVHKVQTFTFCFEI